MFRSAVDIVKIASETIEGLFNMRLALPVALVRALTEGLDEVLREWVSIPCIYACLHTTTPPQAACAFQPLLHCPINLHLVALTTLPQKNLILPFVAAFSMTLST